MNKYLVSVVITLGISISGGDTVFCDRVKIIDLGNRAHVLKYLYGRNIIGQFERCFSENFLWRVHRPLIDFIIIF